MKLHYVTTAMLRAGSAQAVQIFSMAKAFAEMAGDGAFRLISCDPGPVHALAGGAFDWARVKCFFGRRSLRYVEFAVRVALRHRGFRGQAVYTRDIGVAALLGMLGARVTYEMHHDLRTAAGRAIFRLARNRIRFVAISGALKQYMVKQLGVQADRVLVAHDGVFMDRYDAHRSTPRDALRVKLGLPADRFLLMHTGSLYRGRGIELFEPILRNLPDVRCVSVGGSEADRTRWAEHYRHHPSIEFRPHQPQDVLVQYQMAADALLFPMTRASPIWWCTSPLKLFEYLASGVPIVGSSVGSAGEIIGEHNAVLFDPDDADSLVRAVRDVMGNPVPARARACRGLEQVRQGFTWQARARAILRFVTA